MKRFFTLPLFVLSISFFAQNVNYEIRILQFDLNGEDDGFGADEEPTWKAWSKDDINSTLVGGTCYQMDSNEPFAYQPGTPLLNSQNNTSATSIYIQLEGWEDDNISSADRCTYDSGDDGHVNSLSGAIAFRNDPQCQWNDYIYSDGSFSVTVQVKWEYTTFDGGNSLIECGTSTTLEAQGSGVWSIYTGSNGSFVSTLNPTTTFSGDANSNYVLLWSNLANCLTSYQADTVQIDLISTPFPNLTASESTFCENNLVDFTAQDGTLYEWSVNTVSNIVASDGSGAFSFTPTLSDTKVIVNAINGSCSATDSIEFTVLASPTPTINYTGGTLTTETYSFYQWFYNGTSIPGASSNSYVPTQGGSYTVQVLSANGCMGESDAFAVVGVDEYLINLSIYPNPTSGKITLSSDNSIEQIQLFNSIGQMESVALTNNQLDLSDLPEGIYFLAITFENKITSKQKIVLSK